MKEANASINLEINVNCIHCDEYIDLLELTEMTDDGFIYYACLGNEQWGCDDFNEEVECPQCKKYFKVKTIDW